MLALLLTPSASLSRMTTPAFKQAGATRMTVINNVPRDDFQREERYVVVKISKMHPHPEFRRQHLAALKAENSAALVDCLVIEKDWPEYEVAWSMIEARVTGATAQPAADADAIAWRRRDGVLGLSLIHISE